MFGQCQPPWLHRMRLAKMHVLDPALVVEGDVVPRFGDAVFFHIVHDLAGELLVPPELFIFIGEGRRRRRIYWRVGMLVPVRDHAGGGRSRAWRDIGMAGRPRPDDVVANVGARDVPVRHQVMLLLLKDGVYKTSRCLVGFTRTRMHDSR